MSICPLADLEAEGTFFRSNVGDLHRVDLRVRRPVPNVALESLERFRFPFGRDLHSSVRQILNPPVQALPNGCGPGEVAEAHALDASADEVVPRATHDEE
jgi:hypothetical protein